MSAAIQRIALITGASKGIGFEIARELGKAGLHALVGARSAPLGKAAEAQLNRKGSAPASSASTFTTRKRSAPPPDDGPTGGFFSAGGREPW